MTIDPQCSLPGPLSKSTAMRPPKIGRLLRSIESPGIMYAGLREQQPDFERLIDRILS